MTTLAKYDMLLEEASQEAEKYRSAAKRLIPEMYRALLDEDPEMTPADARDRIEKDCVNFWAKRTILDALPDEAKDARKKRSGKRPRKKDFAAEPAAKSVALDANGRTVIDPLCDDDNLAAKSANKDLLTRCLECERKEKEIVELIDNIRHGSSRFPSAAHGSDDFAVVRLDLLKLGSVVAEILNAEEQECYLLVDGEDVLAISTERDDLERDLRQTT
jgi:hypothetical protein